MSYHVIESAYRDAVTSRIVVKAVGTTTIKIPDHYWASTTNPLHTGSNVDMLVGDVVELDNTTRAFVRFLSLRQYNESMGTGCGVEPKVSTTDDHGDSIILRGSENPTGWKLEELLSVLHDEVRDKCLKIECDLSLEAQTVLHNNMQIMGLLLQAEALQRQSYAILDAKAPNQGPLGTPRIGNPPDPEEIMA